MESVNQSLGNLLPYLVMDHGSIWNLLLPHAKFAYNNSVNQGIGHSPFEVVTGLQPRALVDLTPLLLPSKPGEGPDNFVQHVHQVHAKVHKRIKVSNTNYKQQAKCQ